MAKRRPASIEMPDWMTSACHSRTPATRSIAPSRRRRLSRRSTSSDRPRSEHTQPSIDRLLSALSTREELKKTIENKEDTDEQRRVEHHELHERYSKCGSLKTDHCSARPHACSGAPRSGGGCPSLRTGRARALAIDAATAVAEDLLHCDDLAFHARDLLQADDAAPAVAHALELEHDLDRGRICARIERRGKSTPVIMIICSRRPSASRGVLAWIVVMEPSSCPCSSPAACRAPRRRAPRRR